MSGRTDLMAFRGMLAHARHLGLDVSEGVSKADGSPWAVIRAAVPARPATPPAGRLGKDASEASDEPCRPDAGVPARTDVPR